VFRLCFNLCFLRFNQPNRDAVRTSVVEINPCLDVSYCAHGEVCVRLSLGVYVCQCPPGFVNVTGNCVGQFTDTVLLSDVNKNFSPRTRTRTWVPRTRISTSHFTLKDQDKDQDLSKRTRTRTRT